MKTKIGLPPLACATWLGIAAAIALADTAFAQTGAAVTDLSGRMDLAVTDGRVTLQAEEMPLRDVLRAIADRAGFAIEFRGPVDRAVSQEIGNLPVRRAISRLLESGGYSYVLEFSSHRAPGQRRAIAKLTVIESGSETAGRAAGPRPASPTRGALEPEPDVAVAETEEAIEALRDVLATEQDPEVRRAAEQALSEIGRGAAK